MRTVELVQFIDAKLSASPERKTLPGYLEGKAILNVTGTMGQRQNLL